MLRGAGGHAGQQPAARKRAARFAEGVEGAKAKFLAEEFRAQTRLKPDRGWNRWAAEVRIHPLRSDHIRCMLANHKFLSLAGEGDPRASVLQGVRSTRGQVLTLATDAERTPFRSQTILRGGNRGTAVRILTGAWTFLTTWEGREARECGQECPRSKSQ